MTQNHTVFIEIILLKLFFVLLVRTISSFFSLFSSSNWLM
jgi:hypothetical protein